MGGGQLVEQAIHMYDLAIHLFGPVKTISTNTARLVHTSNDYQVEDTSVSLLQFTNGALGTIHATNAAIPDRFCGDWRGVWDKFTIDATIDGDWRTDDSATLNPSHEANIASETIAEKTDAYAAEDADFIRAIAEQRSAECPVSATLHTHEVVFSALESAAQNGTAITIK